MAKTTRTTRQFGIFQIAVLTALVAVICVPLGSFVRGLPPENRPRAIIGILSGSAALMGMIGITFFRRLRAERMAGATKLRLPTTTTKAYHILNGISCLFFFLGACAALYAYTTKQEAFGLQLVAQSWWWGADVTTYLTMLWCGIDPTQHEFCEKGIITRALQADPWSKFRAYRWGKINSNELFLLRHGDFYQLKVRPELRSAVIEQLEAAGLPESPEWS